MPFSMNFTSGNLAFTRLKFSHEKAAW